MIFITNIQQLMKHLFSYVLSALLCITFTTASAQQNIYIWKNGGRLSVKAVSNTDSLTFEVGSWLFHVSTSSATSVTTSTLQASANVSFAEGVESISKSPEVGICYSSTNATPTYEADEHWILGNEVKDYDFTIYELDPGTAYYYRAYVKLEDIVIYGEVRLAATSGEKPSSTGDYVLINGHKFVDLGLPSGLLWAKTNVGAASSSADGDYFAWGETETKDEYSWETYKWGKVPSKYCAQDGENELQTEDDAASVKWGKGCRMPWASEFKELIDECEWTWQWSYNGAKGYLVTGMNGNTIFIPASGLRADNEVYNKGFAGQYWLRSLSGIPGAQYAYYFYFHSGYIYPADRRERYYGCPIRPVAER